MTLLELLDRTTDFFEKKSVESPRLHAELLTAHVLQKKRLSLYLEHDRPVSDLELDQLRPLVKRCSDHEPIQYILGSAEFCGLQLAVTPDVLIPRPETEWLVELVIQNLGSLATGCIADVGTGSGAIALALAAGLPGWEIHATDLSPAAIDIAKANQNSHPELEVAFHQGHLLEPLSTLPITTIVSNLPYLTDQEMSGLPENVKHEPTLALHGGQQGLDLINELIQSLGDHQQITSIFLECGLGQPEILEEVLDKDGWQTKIYPDAQERNRFFFAQRVYEPNCK
ncbi:MAG: peptide chain release factor N(5)-glutamine methyltransferase [Verrucomicrobiota bacterium]